MTFLRHEQVFASTTQANLAMRSIDTAEAATACVAGVVTNDVCRLMYPAGKAGPAQ